MGFSIFKDIVMLFTGYQWVQPLFQYLNKVSYLMSLLIKDA